MIMFKMFPKLKHLHSYLKIPGKLYVNYYC